MPRQWISVFGPACNLGLAGAFQAGIKYAYRHGYDCAIQFDADGQHLPQYIHDLEQALQTSDIVIGSRFIDQPKDNSLRMFGSNIIQGAIKLTTGQVIHDPTSGMRAFNKRMIKLLALGSTWSRARYCFIPYSCRPCQSCRGAGSDGRARAGESYFNWKSSAKYMLRMTLSILFIQFFRKSLEGECA